MTATRIPEAWLDPDALYPGEDPGAEYLAAALGPREDERRRLFAEAEARREAEQREADRQRAREHHARRRLARGGTR